MHITSEYSTKRKVKISIPRVNHQFLIVKNNYKNKNVQDTLI